MPTGSCPAKPTATTNRRSRAIVAAALVTTLATSTGCSSWRPLTPETPDSYAEDRFVRIHKSDTTYEIKAKEKHGPLVTGDYETGGYEPLPVVIDLREVDGAEMYAPPQHRNKIIAVTASVGGAAIVAGVLIAALASFSSGPGFLGGAR